MQGVAWRRTRNPHSRHQWCNLAAEEDAQLSPVRLGPQEGGYPPTVETPPSSLIALRVHRPCDRNVLSPKTRPLPPLRQERHRSEKYIDPAASTMYTINGGPGERSETSVNTWLAARRPRIQAFPLSTHSAATYETRQNPASRPLLEVCKLYVLLQASIYSGTPWHRSPNSKLLYCNLASRLAATA